MPSVAVVGASRDRNKYGNKCVRAYLNKNWTVYPVNPHEAEIEGLRVYRSLAEVPQPIDRVSYYLSPDTGVRVMDEVAAASPGELFLNPGTESPQVVEKARRLGINFRLECAIVDIGEIPGRYR